MSDFELHLLNDKAKGAAATDPRTVRKYSIKLSKGQNTYDIVHGLATEDVVIQTRIAGRVREGGVKIVDLNTVRIEFGGPLHEDMDVVILG